MNGFPVPQPAAAHLNDEQLLDVYYGELDGSEHLGSCVECRSRLERLRGDLDSLNHYVAPHRDPGYGAAVWNRLLPKLPPPRPPRVWLRWWTMAPAFAALLIVAFVTGRLVERGHSTGISTKSRERILLMSLSDHLEQSQIVLTNIANVDAEKGNLEDERARAHELIGANRLLRQTAARLGDSADAALLDELERVLLDVANGPDGRLPGDLMRTQQQIKQEGLLFKVRVTSTAAREKGEKL